MSLDEAFASFEEQWSLRLAGEANDHAVKLANAEGEFVWHHHDEADELFFVVSGRLRIEFREESDTVLEAGEFLIVPKGVEHRPVANVETELMLFEPKPTRNTGNVETTETETDLERIE